jgi:cyanophycinase
MVRSVWSQWLRDVLSTMRPIRSRRRRQNWSQGPWAAEVLEYRQLLSVTAASTAASGTLLVPSGDMQVHFFADSQNTPYQDELGYFYVDGPDGRITLRQGDDPTGAPLLDASGNPQYVRPGDAGYAQAALGANNSHVVFAQGQVPNPGTGDTIVGVADDLYIGFYLVQNDTTQDWRDAATGSQPDVWFSFTAANADGAAHIVPTTPHDPSYRANLVQYKVDDTSSLLPNSGGLAGDNNFDDFVFSANIIPLASEDDYSVFNSGSSFNGKPVGFNIDSPTDTVNRGLGLLWNDGDFRPQPQLVVSAIAVDSNNPHWMPVTDATGQKGTTLSASKLHGSVTVFANGGIVFTPDPLDSYWNTSASSNEPNPVIIDYQLSDGIDTATGVITVSHGYYHLGGAVDSQHTGKPMYLLAGGGNRDRFADGETRFFTNGAAGGDIVLIAQGAEQKNWVKQVYADFVGGKSRSVTGLNITTRDQANDPRIVKIVNGADALWLGGGAQSYYKTIWSNTNLYSALAHAASSSSVAIGGTSAGMAILGQAAYVDIPWDSVQSTFAPERPFDARVNVVTQAAGGLPFGGLSDSPDDPLAGIVTDTHFSVRDRMARMITFAARSKTIGVGVDQDTALLIEKSGNDWLWSVYGDGNVYVVGQSSGGSLQPVSSTLADNGRLTTNTLSVIRLPATGIAGAMLQSAIFAMPATYHIKVSAGTAWTADNGGSLY